MHELKGSTFLKVMGILMIVFAAIALVIGLIALAGIGAMLSLLGASAAQFASIITVASVLTLAGAVLELVAGILGVKNWARPERAGVCVTWGVILIVLCALSLLLNIIVYANVPGVSVNFFTLIVSFVMPVLYLIAAIQCKNLGR